MLSLCLFNIKKDLISHNTFIMILLLWHFYIHIHKLTNNEQQNFQWTFHRGRNNLFCRMQFSFKLQHISLSFFKCINFSFCWLYNFFIFFFGWEKKGIDHLILWRIMKNLKVKNTAYIPHRFSNDTLRSFAFASASFILTLNFSRSILFSCISSSIFWWTFTRIQWY